MKVMSNKIGKNIGKFVNKRKCFKIVFQKNRLSLNKIVKIETEENKFYT